MTIRICDYCGKTPEKKESKLMCSGCGIGVYYCNADCQKTYWKMHKRYCKEVRKHYTGANSPSKHYPFDDVEDFLLMKVNKRTAKIPLKIISYNSDDTVCRNSDNICTALMVSGYLEVAVDLVMERPEFDFKQRRLARSMATIICEKDIVCYYLLVNGEVAHLPDSASFFELPAEAGELPIGIYPYLKAGPANNLMITNQSPILELAKLKVLLSTVRSLERLEKKRLRGGLWKVDDELIVALTRMVARCIRFWNEDKDFLDISMLKVGALSGSSLDSWHKDVVQPCRTEYGMGGITTKLLTPKILEEKMLTPLSPQDVALCRWLLGVETAVFITIAAFVKGGSWRRAPEVAETCESWEAFRRLLYVGARGSNGEFDSDDVWERETKEAVKALQNCPVENRDGSRSRMPTIVAVSTPQNDNVHMAEEAFMAP